jgi:hypothetical protein
MKTDCQRTKHLVQIVLDAPLDKYGERLHQSLSDEDQSQGEFFAGIIEHHKSLGLTTHQWFELLSRLPENVLRKSLDLKSLLSLDQIENLPPSTL